MDERIKEVQAEAALNAEHFFSCFLSHRYGENYDPLTHWRSSLRKKVYHDSSMNHTIDDRYIFIIIFRFIVFIHGIVVVDMILKLETQSIYLILSQTKKFRQAKECAFLRSKDVQDLGEVNSIFLKMKSNTKKGLRVATALKCKSFL